MNDNDRRSEDRWRLTKEINVVGVIAVISAALALVFSYTTMDKRVTLVENAVSQQEVVDRRQDEENKRIQDRRDRQIEIIVDKLDKLLSRK